MHADALHIEIAIAELSSRPGGVAADIAQIRVGQITEHQLPDPADPNKDVRHG